MKLTEFHRRQIRIWLCSPEQASRRLRPAIILCHGLPAQQKPGKERGYLELAEQLCERGFHCICFNFSGCGESGGNLDMRAWFDDLSHVIHQAQNLPGIDSIHCVGFSTGGAIAAKVASLHDEIRSLMLMATPADFSEIITPDAAELREHFVTLGMIRDHDFPADLDKWYAGFMELQAEKWLPLIAPRPVCIVHGDEDETVPVAHAHRLYESCYRPAELKILANAKHQLRKDERCVELIADWIGEHA